MIAWFWKQPYKRSPIAWGTLAFESEWFAAHFEFRYPVFARVTHAGIIGEEPTGGTTTRWNGRSRRRRLEDERRVHGHSRVPTTWRLPRTIADAGDPLALRAGGMGCGAGYR